MTMRSMASSSAAGKGKKSDSDSRPSSNAALPLVKCPCCHSRTVVRLVSGSAANPGRVFFKCPNHRKTAAGEATVQPQMKLLVDKRSRQVLYAEVRKDVVDFLIGLLRVPTGLAAGVIANSKQAGAAAPVAPPGSLGTLYAGARALEDAFFVAAAPDRDGILGPSLPSAALPLLLTADPSAPAPAPPPPPPPSAPELRCSGGYGAAARGNPTLERLDDAAGIGVGLPRASSPPDVDDLE